MKRIMLIAMALWASGCGSGESELEHSFSCTGSYNGAALQYDVKIYSSGSVSTSCSISGGTIEASGSRNFQSSDTGASEYGCGFNFDLDNTQGLINGGFWAFFEKDGARKAVYSEPGDPLDDTTVVFDSANCASN